MITYFLDHAGNGCTAVGVYHIPPAVSNSHHRHTQTILYGTITKRMVTF